jgi:hypothetical protein
MTNKKQADEIAALKKKVEELEARISPPKSTFVPMSDAEWIDKMHQMREGRMSLAMPPSAVRDLNVIPDDVCRDIVSRGGVRGPSQSGGKR